MRPPSFGTLAFQMRSLLARLGSCFVTKICEKKHVDERLVNAARVASDHALRPGVPQQRTDQPAAVSRAAHSLHHRGTSAAVRTAF